MGLDQNIYRIRKVKLEDRVFKRNELEELYNFIPVNEADEDVEEVIPYATVRKVEFEFIDVENMFKDFNIPSKAHLGMMSSEKYIYSWTDHGEYKSVEVPTKEITEKIIERIWNDEHQTDISPSLYVKRF